MTHSIPEDIVVRLTGGLGNQMFQYAYAKALQLNINCNVKLDIHQCQWHARHRWELDRFNISLPIASVQEIAAYCSNPPPARKLGLLEKLSQKAGEDKLFRILFRKYLKQNIILPDLHQLPELLDKTPFSDEISQPCYSSGYWQNADYFRDHDAVIQNEFKLLQPLSQSARQFLQLIQTGGSTVSVHIRRGDYLSRKVRKMFDVLSMHYYHSAMQKMHEYHGDVVFVIFGDDIEWARENFKNPRSEILFVDSKHPGYEDLHLMSCCQHHIIANSTFSWWGAWLGANPDKTVIAPKKWALGEEAGKITARIIPAEWETV